MQSIKNWGKCFATLPIDQQVILVCGAVCAVGYFINAIKR